MRRNLSLLAIVLAVWGHAAGAQQPVSFDSLLAEHWRWVLAGSPQLATTLGVRAYDRQLGDLTLAHFDQRAREAGQFLARFERMDTTRLAPPQRVTLAILRRDLAEQVEGNRFGQRAVLFTTYYGWWTGFADIGERHPFREPADYEAYVARLAAFPAYNRGGIATTRVALREGYAQPCAPLEGFDRTISGVTAAPPDSSRFMAPFARRPAFYGEGDWSALRERALAAVRDSVYPAYDELLRFYRAEYAPGCRREAGVSATPGGLAYYAYRLRTETTTRMTPDEVFALGQREVARIGRAMDSLARGAGYADRAAWAEALRRDPRYYATTPAGLLAAAAWEAKRIEGEMPRFFGRLPRLPFTVKPIPDAIAPGTTTAYYGGGSLEGARAGTYWVNTSKLDERPLYELPALTAHEAVPGHHQQISIGREMELPPVRRYGVAFAAFTEGWGLYAERLAEDMGIYDTPEKMFGHLSYEMWRACRIVVDPGIHAKGWTREQAIAFMLANTGLTRANVEAEVNRYITWPGQASAYKIGELKIRELRARAEARLGANFDVRAFHDAVLENGAVPLDVLESLIDAWIARQLAGAASAGG